MNAVLKALIESFNPTICLGMVECGTEMLNSFTAQEVGEVCRGKLRPIVSSDGTGHAPASKQTLQYLSDGLCCHCPGWYYLRPSRLVT